MLPTFYRNILKIQSRNDKTLTFCHFFLYTDAKTDEFLEIKFFNHEFQASDSEMHVMLKKANLTGHGYKKEVITKVVRKAEGGREYEVCITYVCYKSSASNVYF